MRNLFTLIFGTLMCAKQITSNLRSSQYEVPIYEPKNSRMVADSLSKIGEKFEKITPISLFEKDLVVGRSDYKFTYRNKEGDACFVTWHVIPLIGTTNIKGPTCIRSKSSSGGTKKMEKRIKNMEITLRKISDKIIGIRKTFDKLNSRLKSQNVTLSLKFDEGSGITEDSVINYLLSLLKKAHDRQEKGLTSKSTTTEGASETRKQESWWVKERKKPKSKEKNEKLEGTKEKFTVQEPEKTDTEKENTA